MTIAGTVHSSVELWGNLEADGNDTLKLNVGGARMICKRSTLTIFPDSKLAKMFSGRWDKKLLRDKQNRIFLDVNPACFKLILDYLTFCATSPPKDYYLFVADISQELKPMYDALCSLFDISMASTALTVRPLSRTNQAVLVLRTYCLAIVILTHASEMPSERRAQYLTPWSKS